MEGEGEAMMIEPDPLRDMQQEEPVTRCPRCGGEVWAGEAMFDWNRGGFVCLDCFHSAVTRLLDRDPRLMAVELGVACREV